MGEENADGNLCLGNRVRRIRADPGRIGAQPDCGVFGQCAFRTFFSGQTGDPAGTIESRGRRTSDCHRQSRGRNCRAVCHTGYPGGTGAVSEEQRQDSGPKSGLHQGGSTIGKETAEQTAAQTVPGDGTGLPEQPDSEGRRGRSGAPVDSGTAVPSAG